MQRKIRRLAVGMLLMTGCTAMAQTTVKGKLVDAEDGEPIIGASVVVKGTSQGTDSRHQPEGSDKRER